MFLKVACVVLFLVEKEQIAVPLLLHKNSSGALQEHPIVSEQTQWE